MTHKIRIYMKLYKKLSYFSTMIPNAETLTKMWNSKAENYSANMEHFNLATALNLTNMLEIQKAQRILEIGCGSGDLSLYWLKQLTKAESYISSDISDKMIEVAKKKKENALGINPKIHHEFIVANAEDLNTIQDESIDMYVAHLVLFFVPDAVKAIQEAKRVLCKGGRAGFTLVGPIDKNFYINISKSFAEVGFKMPEMRRPDYLGGKEELTKLFKENGFNVEFCWIHYIYYPLYDMKDIESLLNGPDLKNQFSKFDESQQEIIKNKIFAYLQGEKSKGNPMSTELVSIIVSKPNEDSNANKSSL